jgi:hypothetical protein
MNIRSARQLRFNVALKNHPNDHAKAINDFVAQTRAAMVRGGRIWIVILLFTVLPGFLAALLLIYNVSADLAGLRSLP